MGTLHAPARHAAPAALAVAWVLAGGAVSAGEAKAKDPRPVLAVLAVKAGPGFAQGEAESVEALLLGALDDTGRFRVIGRADIQTLLDLEAKKEAADCGDGTACMVAIAGALGADYVASADLGKLGNTTVLAFRVVEVRTAAVLVHANQTVQAQDELVQAVEVVAKRTAASVGVTGAARPAAAPAEVHAVPAEALQPAPARRPSVWHPVGIAAAVVGAVALAAGTGLGIAAQAQTAAARTTGPTSTPLARANAINGLVSGAVAGWAGGGVVAAAGVGLLVVF